MTSQAQESRSLIERWLVGVNSETPITLDDHGQCVLQAEQQPEITIEQIGDEPSVSLYAPLVSIAPEHRSACYGYVLGLNLYQRFTRGGALALDPASNYIVLNYRHDVQIEGIEAETLIGEFSLTASLLRDNIEEFVREVSSQGSEVDESSPATTDEMIIKA